MSTKAFPAAESEEHVASDARNYRGKNVGLVMAFSRASE